eukprot:g3463.t1
MVKEIEMKTERIGTLEDQLSQANDLMKAWKANMKKSEKKKEKETGSTLKRMIHAGCQTEEIRKPLQNSECQTEEIRKSVQNSECQTEQIKKSVQNSECQTEEIRKSVQNIDSNLQKRIESNHVACQTETVSSIIQNSCATQTIMSKPANMQTVDTCMQTVDVQTQSVDAQTQLVDTYVQTADVQTQSVDAETQLVDTYVQTADVQRQLVETYVQTADVQTQLVDAQTQTSLDEKNIDENRECQSDEHDEFSSTSLNVSAIELFDQSEERGASEEDHGREVTAHDHQLVNENVNEKNDNPKTEKNANRRRETYQKYREIESLKRDIRSLEKVIEDKINHTREMKQELLSNETLRKADHQKFSELQEKYNSSQNDLRSTQEELGKTRQELDKTRQEFGKTRDELDKIREDFGKTREELVSTQEELATIQNDYRLFLKEREEERESHVKAEMEMQEKTSSLSLLAAERFDSLTSLETSLSRAEETRKDEEKQWNAEKRSFKKQISELESSVRVTREEIIQRRRELAKAIASETQTRKSLRECEDQLSFSLEQLAASRNEASERENLISQLKISLKTSEEREANLLKKNKEIRGKLQSLVQSYESDMKEVHALFTDRIEALEESLKERDSAISRSTAMLKASGDELSACRKHLDDSQRSNVEFMKELEVLKSENLVNVSKVTKFEETVQTQEQKLQSQEQKLQSQEQKLQTQEDKVQTQRAIIQSQEEKLQSQEQKLQTQENKLQSQEEKLQTQRAIIQSQENKVKSLQKEHKKKVQTDEEHGGEGENKKGKSTNEMSTQSCQTVFTELDWEDDARSISEMKHDYESKLADYQNDILQYETKVADLQSILANEREKFHGEEQMKLKVTSIPYSSISIGVQTSFDGIIDSDSSAEEKQQSTAKMKKTTSVQNTTTTPMDTDDNPKRPCHKCHTLALQVHRLQMQLVMADTVAGSSHHHINHHEEQGKKKTSTNVDNDHFETKTNDHQDESPSSNLYGSPPSQGEESKQGGMPRFGTPLSGLKLSRRNQGNKMTVDTGAVNLHPDHVEFPELLSPQSTARLLHGIASLVAE